MKNITKNQVSRETLTLKKGSLYIQKIHEKLEEPRTYLFEGFCRFQKRYIFTPYASVSHSDKAVKKSDLNKWLLY